MREHPADLSPILAALFALARRLTPASERTWLEDMRLEAAFVASGPARWRWISGALALALQLRLTTLLRGPATVALTGAAAALVAVVILLPRPLVLAPVPEIDASAAKDVVTPQAPAEIVPAEAGAVIRPQAQTSDRARADEDANRAVAEEQADDSAGLAGAAVPTAATARTLGFAQDAALATEAKVPPTATVTYVGTEPVTLTTLGQVGLELYRADSTRPLLVATVPAGVELELVAPFLLHVSDGASVQLQVAGRSLAPLGPAGEVAEGQFLP